MMEFENGRVTEEVQEVAEVVGVASEAVQEKELEMNSLCEGCVKNDVCYKEKRVRGLEDKSDEFMEYNGLEDIDGISFDFKCTNYKSI
jgi:hypothetical protein